MMGMAFVGCVFVKCSITHILCASLYILPMLGVNAAFCIIGIVELRNLSPMPIQDLIISVNNSFRKTGRYPEWLTNIEFQLPCCGIHSFLDYPLVFRRNGTIPNFSGIIPKSCCISQRAKMCNLMLDSGDNRTGTEVWNLIVNKKNCTDHSMSSLTVAYKYSEADMKYNMFSPAENITERIYPCGCYTEIHSMTGGLYQSHLIYFVSVIIMSLIMALVYVKLWCRHRGSNTDSGSDHSLDVELEVKTSDTDLASVDVAGSVTLSQLNPSDSLNRPSVMGIRPESSATGRIPAPKAKPNINNIRRVASTLPAFPGKK